MEIFVEKDGQKFGPFTMAQLKHSLAAADIAGDHLAWVDGAQEASTVARIIAKDAFAPKMIGGGQPHPAQERQPPAPKPSPSPPPPGGSDIREQSSKLRPPSSAPQSLPGDAAAKFRRSRRSRVVALPKPTTWEQLRIAGTATPVLLALVLLLPWISGAFRPELASLNGYRSLAELTDLAPIRRLFVGTLWLGSLGIGWCSLRGALEGGSDMPAATFLSAAVAAGSLLVLALALPAESRSITHLGGATAAFGTLLLGSAFGGIPGRDQSPSSSLIMWTVCACLALGALICFLVASN